MENDPVQEGEDTAAPATQAAAAPPPIDWAVLIAEATAIQKVTVRANTFVHLYRDDSKPVEVICDDGHTYVVKSLWADVSSRPPDAEVKESRSDEEQGRRMFNDQVCGRLGAAMGASVPTVCLIEITDDLIKANPKTMGHLKPCVGHGSRKIPDVTGKVGDFAHAEKGDNRQRYNKLSVFFGWLVSGDMQFIKGTQPPHTVYSHDHGHFLPGGPMWTQASLDTYVVDPTPTPQIVNELKLKPEETAQAGEALKMITADNIVEALAAAPDDWNVPLADRVALATFVHARQERLLQTISLPPNGKAP